MTRINHHALGASRRLPPRITLLASSTKFKFKEERKRILKLSVKKLRSIEDPEAFLSKSVLINNTLKRLQTEVREEKAERKKCAELPDYNPSPYSFYSIEKAYREEMERLDNNGNNPDSTSASESAAGPASSSLTPIAALSASSNNSAVATSASNFNPNISALPVSLQCANSHKENLFSATVHTTSSNQNLASNHHNQNSSALDTCDNRSRANPSQTHSTSAPSSLSDKCYSCGQSSLFQSELQSVVFSSLIASLET